MQAYARNSGRVIKKSTSIDHLAFIISSQEDPQLGSSRYLHFDTEKILDINKSRGEIEEEVISLY